MIVYFQRYDVIIIGPEVLLLRNDYRLNVGTVVTLMLSEIIAMENVSETTLCSAETQKVFRYYFTMMKLRFGSSRGKHKLGI